MSFRRPQHASQRTLRHARSSSTLAGLRQARQSRNSFQRRPMRTSHSTQCLLPTDADAGVVGDDNEEVVSYSVAAYTAAACGHVDSFSGSDSEYSEYDLVNDQMQDFLLDSEDTSDNDGSGLDAVFMGGFMPAGARSPSRARAWRRTTTPDRRRMAKKSESAASLSSPSRLTPSTSTAMLSDVDATLREVAAISAAAQRHASRKQRRALAAGERRWLVPALAACCSDSTLGPDSERVQVPYFTVVFDLDETLVAARHGPIQLRPHVGELLRALHRLPIEIVVWTAGTARYVNPILQAIGQSCGRRQWFHHIISRHKRWFRGANASVKDLGQLGRPLQRLVMIENNPISALPQPSLCVLVEDYLRPNPADDSLLLIRDLLARLAGHYAAASELVACPAEADASLSVADLIVADAALQPVEFSMEDLLNEDGISMVQRVEMRERVGGAQTLTCLCLRYTPPPPASRGARSLPASSSAAEAPVSVARRSYGAVSPLLRLAP